MFERKFGIFGIIGALILIAIAIFLAIKGGGYSANQPEDSFKRLQGGALGTLSGTLDERQPVLDVEEEKNELKNTYKNSQYGFSFQYPDEFKIAEFTEGDFGDIVLAQGPSENSVQAGFQIFITPFDEPAGPITKERILQDEPSMIVENGQLIQLPSGIQAFAFLSKNQSLGNTLEVWFVRDGYLYQISTYASLVEFMTKILGTFSF